MTSFPTPPRRISRSSYGTSLLLRGRLPRSSCIGSLVKWVSSTQESQTGNQPHSSGRPLAVEVATFTPSRSGQAAICYFRVLLKYRPRRLSHPANLVPIWRRTKQTTRGGITSHWLIGIDPAPMIVKGDITSL